MKDINNHQNKISNSVMEVLADARATDVVANQVAEKVLETKSMAPFLDIKSARPRPLAPAAPNNLMSCIWETAESHTRIPLLQNGTLMDSAGMEDLYSFLCKCICMSYVCHMTDLSFLTESVTGVDRCGKKIVDINLPEGCLSTEFNLLTVL